MTNEADILRLKQHESELEYVPIDQVSFDNDAGKALKWQQLYFEAAGIIEAQKIHIETMQKLLEITSND